MEWMKLPPMYWPKMSSFIKFSKFVNNLPVSNDSAERNVKLIQDFVNTYHKEDTRQDLLIAVEKKRKERTKSNQSKKQKV